MFILRSVRLDDLDDLFELSSKMVFINLPHDRAMIQHKIESSLEAFKNPSPNLWENYYIFVLEDLDNNQVVGVSMIHAQHGTEEEPHFYLRVGKEHRFSETINTGFMHGTLKLGLEFNGPTEIGGLILHPDYRGSAEKLGKQISFVRFLYMGQHPDRFKPVVHSELMPPFDSEGRSPLWEALGRRFMNMNYNEADVLSRSNKEFILNLFPTENIYVTLLPMEARNAIGQVGEETLGVKKMLTSIGFKYVNEVDPFDGGPHYRCDLAKIKPIREMMRLKFRSAPIEDGMKKSVLVEVTNSEYDFYAFRADIVVDKQSQFCNFSSPLPPNLKLSEGQVLACIPF